MNGTSVHLAPETEIKIRERAGRTGQTVEGFLEGLVDKLDAPPKYLSDPRPTAAEFASLLGELAAGPSLPVLPADFSRADIYDDAD